MLRSSSARILPTVTSADRTADISNRLIVVTTVVATVGCVYPGFLIGAVTVQVRNEFGVSAATYGWAMGTYFLACLLYTSPSPRDLSTSRMPSSA